MISFAMYKMAKNNFDKEIPDIKSKLTIQEVLHHYNLSPDRNNRLCCPFHPDKTPSLQIYPKTDTAYCFSSNCKTHGKSLDVIDFVMFKERFKEKPSSTNYTLCNEITKFVIK